jgi:hypothetical protein
VNFSTHHSFNLLKALHNLFHVDQVDVICHRDGVRGSDDFINVNATLILCEKISCVKRVLLKLHPVALTTTPKKC